MPKLNRFQKDLIDEAINCKLNYNNELIDNNCLTKTGVKITKQENKDLREIIKLLFK